MNVLDRLEQLGAERISSPVPKITLKPQFLSKYLSHVLSGNIEHGIIVDDPVFSVVLLNRKVRMLLEKVQFFQRDSFEREARDFSDVIGAKVTRGHVHMRMHDGILSFTDSGVTASVFPHEDLVTTVSEFQDVLDITCDLLEFLQKILGKFCIGHDMLSRHDQDISIEELSRTREREEVLRRVERRSIRTNITGKIAAVHTIFDCRCTIKTGRIGTMISDVSV